MEIPVRSSDLFPVAVLELMQALYGAEFFREGMLIGSWVMPLYQDIFGIPYVLRTYDIDFAIRFVPVAEKQQRVDLEKTITDMGYVSVVMQSGVQKFTRENFSIEFIVPRKGGTDDDVVLLKKWNLTAIPLPFVDILLTFPFVADFGNFAVRAPVPEAFFIHKLITAQRRLDTTKRDKDLEQCATIASHLDLSQLKDVVHSVKLSRKVQKAISSSCAAINFPPQTLGVM